MITLTFIRLVFKAAANLSTQLSIIPSTCQRYMFDCLTAVVEQKKNQAYKKISGFFLLLFLSVSAWNICRHSWSIWSDASADAPILDWSSVFCMQWFKAVKWKKTWPYRPPVSDDDEGITAVEAAGGQSVQLQRVQWAVVLTFCKHPEDGAAHMRLDASRRGELIQGRHISRGRQTLEKFSALLSTAVRVQGKARGDKWQRKSTQDTQLVCLEPLSAAKQAQSLGHTDLTFIKTKPSGSLPSFAHLPPLILHKLLLLTWFTTRSTKVQLANWMNHLQQN